MRPQSLLNKKSKNIKSEGKSELDLQAGMLLLLTNLTSDLRRRHKTKKKKKKAKSKLQSCSKSEVDRVWVRSNLDVCMTLVCKHMVNLIINYCGTLIT